MLSLSSKKKPRRTQQPSRSKFLDFRANGLTTPHVELTRSKSVQQGSISRCRYKLQIRKKLFAQVPQGTDQPRKLRFEEESRIVERKEPFVVLLYDLIV